MTTWTEGNIKKVGFAIKRPEYMTTVSWPVIFIKVGHEGFWEATEAEDLPDEVIESAIVGSMFGWDCPGARLAVEYANEILRST